MLRDQQRSTWWMGNSDVMSNGLQSDDSSNFTTTQRLSPHKINSKKVSMDNVRKERESSFGLNISVSNQFKNNPASNRYK